MEINKKLYVGKYRNNSVTLELRIEEKNRPAQTIHHEVVDNYQTLSISGSILNDGAGQIHDTLREGLNEYAIPKEKLERILEIWEEYHLNDMKAGCEHQNLVSTSDSDWNKRAAEETAKCPCGYRYGSSWLVRPIPSDILEEIVGLFDGEEETPESKMIIEIERDLDERTYSIQNHAVKLSIRYADRIKKEYGYCNEYVVKLENEITKQSCEFHYFDSVHNTLNKEELHDELVEDVLSCIKSDYFYDEEQYPTFEEFCASFGYNEDSIKDEKLYRDVLEHAEKLQRVFDKELVMLLPD